MQRTIRTPSDGSVVFYKYTSRVMKKQIPLIKRFWKEEAGLSVLEYVVGAGVLATVIAVVFTDWGNTLKNALAAISL